MSHPNKQQIIHLSHQLKETLIEMEALEQVLAEKRERAEDLERELDEALVVEEPRPDTEKLVQRALVPIADDAKSKNDTKKRVLTALLDQGPVFLHFDPRRDGVDLPERLRGQPRQTIIIGHALVPPITDIEVTDADVRATLLFGSATHHVVLPWDSVFAITNGDGQGAAWPVDVPVELRPSDERAHELKSVPMPEGCGPLVEVPDRDPAKPALISVPRPKCWTCLDDERGELIDADGAACYRTCPVCRSDGGPKVYPVGGGTL